MDPLVVRDGGQLRRRHRGYTARPENKKRIMPSIRVHRATRKQTSPETKKRCTKLHRATRKQTSRDPKTKSDRFEGASKAQVQKKRPFRNSTPTEHARMAPARGRATARKPRSKKKTAQEPSASPERSPVRDSEYEVQRKARLAQNADCLRSLEVAKIPARAQATKRNRRTRCAHVNVRSFAVASIRREVCLRAQVAA